MTIREIFKQARENYYAIGSFNFSDSEILKAIVSAANGLNNSVIVSTSGGESNFLGMKQAVALVSAWRQEFPSLSIFLNLDHGKSLGEIKEAVEAGYDMVHFDGSALSYDENVTQTKEAVDFCRTKNILVEGELGYLRGTSSLHEEILEIKEEDLTSPEQALDFVQKTGIDSLAIVIGNAHGIFTKSPEKLHIDRLKKIYEITGDKVFLVLHGGSGVPAEDIKEAIKLGVVKINVNTELRLAYRGALEKFLTDNPNEGTPYKFLASSVEAMRDVVENKIKLFKS